MGMLFRVTQDIIDTNQNALIEIRKHCLTLGDPKALAPDKVYAIKVDAMKGMAKIVQDLPYFYSKQYLEKFFGKEVLRSINFELVALQNLPNASVTNIDELAADVLKLLPYIESALVVGNRLNKRLLLIERAGAGLTTGQDEYIKQCASFKEVSNLYKALFSEIHKKDKAQIEGDFEFYGIHGVTLSATDPPFCDTNKLDALRDAAFAFIEPRKELEKYLLLLSNMADDMSSGLTLGAIVDQVSVLLVLMKKKINDRLPGYELLWSSARDGALKQSWEKIAKNNSTSGQILYRSHLQDFAAVRNELMHSLDHVDCHTQIRFWGKTEANHLKNLLIDTLRISCFLVDTSKTSPTGPAPMGLTLPHGISDATYTVKCAQVLRKIPPRSNKSDILLNSYTQFAMARVLLTTYMQELIAFNGVLGATGLKGLAPGLATDIRLLQADALVCAVGQISRALDLFYNIDNDRKAKEYLDCFPMIARTAYPTLEQLTLSSQAYRGSRTHYYHKNSDLLTTIFSLVGNNHAAIIKELENLSSLVETSYQAYLKKTILATSAEFKDLKIDDAKAAAQSAGHNEEIKFKHSFSQGLLENRRLKFDLKESGGKVEVNECSTM
jgi:hypothetical protein